MKIFIRFLPYIFLSFLFCSNSNSEITEPISIDGGNITGKWNKKEEIAFFMGIPYAAPPVDSLRWRPPQPVVPWNGVKKAYEFSNWAPQYQGKSDQEKYLKVLTKGLGHSKIMQFMVSIFMKIMPPPQMSEDCLYLNVRTGNLKGKEKQPVLVYIHGGAKHFGSGAETFYHSDDLTKKGVVVVTINFRLGILGYFAHPALSEESSYNSCGNYGLLDQVAALEWVKRNISKFGGDPYNVTIMGQSSGGESVAELMSTPLARGLFQRAIIQSGTFTTLSEATGKPFLLREEAEDAGKKWADKIGLKSIKELRDVPAEQLIEKLQSKIDDYGYPFLTVIVDNFTFPSSIASTFQKGKQAQVPLLIGYNKDEGTLFYPIAKYPTPSNWDRNVPEDLDSFRLFMKNIYMDDADTLMSIYKLDDPKSRLVGEIEMRGDDQIGVQAFYLCRQMEKLNIPSYLYFFTATPPSKNQTIGAYHGIELPFIFGTHDNYFVASKDDLILKENIQNYWVSFMENGDPNYKDLPQWDAYSNDKNKWLNINHNLKEERISKIGKLSILERTLIRKIEESNSEGKLNESY